MRKKEIKKLKDEEIDEKIEELRLELAKEKGRIEVGGTPENPGKVKEIKKMIARLLTEKTRRR